ncbi:hypothetical protein AB0I02_20420 [Streptomyces phaeochromogenes]
MARTRFNTRTSEEDRRKTQAIVAVVVLFVLVGGCNQLLALGDSDEQTDDCAMAPVGLSAPLGVIGGGSGGGGFTSGGGSSGYGGGSSSSSGGGGLDDVNVPEYEPGMDVDEISPDMRAVAESEYGEMQAVGTELIWFDKRTGEPFPWHREKHDEAKAEADAVDEALAALEEDC